ncbi:MAG: HAD family phosphatase [Candidatus Obscuribacter sp.]|nr:HAD family phosphatase [Candidatus Obscuribacter sp.]
MTTPSSSPLPAPGAKAQSTSANAWLFIDFDNTMMGTEFLAIPTLVDRFNQLYGAKTAHLLTTEEFQEYFGGQARQSLCQNLSKHFGIDVIYEDLYDSREWRMMQALKTTPVQMAVGLIETLRASRERGLKLAFVSNNPIMRAFAAMRSATNGQGEDLAALFGTAYFEAGDIQKPKPDVYLRALEQVGADVALSYAVEDSVSGVKAAVAAGLKTFGYTGFGNDPIKDQDKLIKAGAHACFSDWRDFLSMI